MGKFEGVLLCSDFDGTISINGMISKENIDAVRYFQAEGGKFTFASGRKPQFFKKFEDQISPNTLLICAGGSCIMDKNENIYYEKFCNSRFGEYAKLLMREDSPYEEMQVTTRGRDTFLFNKKTAFSKEAESVYAMDTIYKAIFLTAFNEEGSKRGLAYTKDLVFEGYMPMRSFPVSIELIPEEGGKGRAVRWLADYLKSRLVVTVGDYENDCDMLKMADYGYAVSGGSPLARMSANRFAATVNGNAVASVIEELDKEIIL